MIEEMRAYFHQGQTRGLSFRKEALRRLKDGMKEREEALLSALKADLGKADFEGYATELGMVYEEIGYVLRHLDGWAKPRKILMPFTQFPAAAAVHPQPKGVALIIAPWNYPVLLTLCPLVDALAAGNCAVVKPSEYAPHTARALEELLSDCFPPEYVRMVQGGVTETQALLARPFDHIFFTGSTKVGKIVMAAAAERLCPVTLELGGKSPCIVEETADVSLAAKRTAWGKLLNAGQTCVAPDYVLVDRKLEQPFIKALKTWIRAFYGDHPLTHEDYPKIISPAHLSRLLGLLEGQHIAFGGETDGVKLAPTLLQDVALDAPVMEEEIFGPILPVIPYDSLDDAFALVRSRPTPLACYVFTQDGGVKRRVVEELPFGGGCINDTIVQLSSASLPFGGFGESGLGAYHGKTGFDTFSHHKTVVERGKTDFAFRYPPYGGKLKWLKRLLK